MSGDFVPFVAVNIGNTTAQFASVRAFDAQGSPTLSDLLEIPSHDLDLEQVNRWFPLDATSAWYIASVYRAGDERLRAWIADQFTGATAKRLTVDDFRLPIDVDEPARVGIDRLAAAVAAVHLKSPKHPACVVDAGTAITVDAVAANGTFLGGAICPGVGIAARALQRYTDALPLVELQGHDVPSALGKNTESAIRAGLYWGAIGTAEQLIDEIVATLRTHYIDLFITGGMREPLARHLTRPAEVVHTLVLQGVAIAVQALRQ